MKQERELASGEREWREPHSRNESWYLFWLSGVPGIGLRTLQKLMGRFGSAEAVYRASRRELEKTAGLSAACRERILSWDGRCGAQGEWEELREKGIRYLSFYNEEYPRRLKALCDPPKHLYVRGGLPEASRHSVGIIGARDCTIYGRDMARLFGYRLAEAGVQVISGMARGIDGISQRAALRAGGKSFAVLGSGADVCYPPENKNLYETLKTRGGILSEYLPGTQPKAGLFPQRNRIISGLADIVLIVEARERSGTLITADMALEQGKEVWVVPGRLTDPLSAGCNRLMKQGAGILTSVEEMLEETGLRTCHTDGGGYIGREPEKTGKAPCREGETFPDMAPEGKSAGIFLYLDDYPKSVEQLQRESGMEYRQTVCELMELCVENRAEQVSAGQYVRKHKADGKL